MLHMHEIVPIRVPRILATVVRLQDRSGHVLQHKLRVRATPLGDMVNRVRVNEDRSHCRRQAQDERHRFRQRSYNLDLSPANYRAKCSLCVRPPISHDVTSATVRESNVSNCTDRFV